MAFDPKFKYYLIDPNTGYYLSSNLTREGNWTFALSADPLPLNTLPDGWDGLTLTWARNVDYHGVFRSYSLELIFSMDGYGVLAQLYKERNAQAQCILRIDMLKSSTVSAIEYTTVYKCLLDFSRYKENPVYQTISIGTIDSGLFSKLELNADNVFPLRYWNPTEAESFTTDATAIYDEGISLLYYARFTDGATSTDTHAYTVGGLVNHTNPTLTNSQIIPYVGNEILADFLQIRSQTLQENAATWDNYTTNSGLLKCELPTTAYNVKPIMNIKGTIRYPNPNPGEQRYFKFEICAIDSTNTLVRQYDFCEFVIDNDPGHAPDDIIIQSFQIVDNEATAIISPYITFTQLTVAIDLEYDRIYTLSYMLDSSIGSPLFGITLTLENNEFFLTSQHIDGIADTDLRYPASTYLGFRPGQVLDLLAQALGSTSVDPAGFPIIPATPYRGVSNFLNDPTLTAAANYDNIPYNTLFGSGTTLRVMPGQTYLEMSVNSMFQTCRAVWGCGLSIDRDSDGEQTLLRIEPLSYYYKKDVEIFNLGTNITIPEFMPLTEYICGQINAGYTTKWQDFSQFIGNNLQFIGADAFNIEQQYRPPMFQGKKKTMNFVAPVVAEPMKKEADRSKQNQPPAMSTAQTPSSPSSGNDTYLIEIESDLYDTPDIPDPAGYGYPVPRYKILTYPGAHSASPTPPYVRGLFFPKTAQNLGLTPAKNMRRNGDFLHSIAKGQEDGNFTFQKQYWNLYNGNTSVTLAGIGTDLTAGLINEVADIPVSSLPDKLWNPTLIKFTTQQPLNMYEIVNANPYGYISARVKNRYGFGYTEIKGFIWEVSQDLGNNSATTFTLLAHPDMEI